MILSSFGVNAQELVLGAQRIDNILQHLLNKNIAIIGNQTSMINQTHLVDSLLSLNQSIKKVFSPEHGFRGKKDAGTHVNDEIDNKTGLPIISLHGKNKNIYY